MNIKYSSLQQKVGILSGGNQQKIMIGKALSIDPKIIIFDEPTRGIDVGSKAEIYRILRNLANEGVGIIVISSELPEIIGLCDRVCILYEGKLCGEVTHTDINEQRILHIASGL
jgi:ribose transport system ATP-binding protein